MGIFTHWPNRITATRFVGAALLFVLFAVYGDRGPEEVGEIRGVLQIAFWLFVVTAATDFLDGWLARRGKFVTAFGRIADPFVDKVLILGAMVFLAEMPWSKPWLPVWVVVVILSRELLITGIRGYVESVGKEFPADRFGKLKMVMQCIAVGDLIWMHAYAWPERLAELWSVIGHVFVWATLVTTIGSGVAYVMKTRVILAGSGP